MIIPDIPDGTTKADAALIYARAGIPVFPVEPGGKNPVGRFAPQAFKNATTNEQVVAGWWRRDPEFNIGSPLDEHTLALDVDDATKALPVTSLLPKTGPVQITGGATPGNQKRHQLYDLNGHDLTSLTRIPDLGIETKGLNKGYILLAPSTTTGTYRWVRTGQPERLPDSLYATLTGKRGKETAKGEDTPLIVITGGPCANWCDRTDTISRNPGGYQYLNDYAFHRVTHHRDTQRGVIEDQLIVLLSRMDPPYPGIEGTGVVGKVVDQIMADIASEKIGPDGPSPSGTVAGGAIGSRTANDLPVGPPPSLIVDGFLVPDNTTLIYGTGGTGKGVIAAVFVARLVREHGMTVMLVDYENHPEEWGRRLDGITFPDGTRLTPEEKDKVIYRSPYDVADWTADTGSLPVIAMALRADCEARGVDYVVVDSYTAATDGEEGMGGQRDAKNFAMAVTKIGRPALVLAHIAGTTERLPDKPFGSIFVRNLVARLMYAMAQVSGESTDEDGPLIAPVTIKVEAKRTKGNNYGRRANRFIEITFHVGGAITWDLDAKPTDLPVWQQIREVLLLEAPAGLTPEKIAQAVNEDFPGDKPAKADHVRVALNQHPDVFVVVGDSRPKEWSVRA